MSSKTNGNIISDIFSSILGIFILGIITYFVISFMILKFVFELDTKASILLIVILNIFIGIVYNKLNKKEKYNSVKMEDDDDKCTDGTCKFNI